MLEKTRSRSKLTKVKKPPKKRKVKTKEEHEHLNRVAGLGCYLCRYIGEGNTKASVHHIREGAGYGMKNSHYLTVPLCEKHHANYSKDGIHGQRLAWKLAGVGEMDALADTIMLLVVDR